MRILLALLLFCVAVAPAGAQEFTAGQRQEIVRTLREALTRDPSILREALVALQADDARRQQAVQRDIIAMLGPRLVDVQDPVAGNPFGDVTVVAFYDTRCPYCRRMGPVLAELIRVDPKVKLVMKDMPILGPGSQLESRALLALQRQGGYFRMQEAIMAEGGTPTRDSLRAMAERLGLDGGRMARDMDEDAIKRRLQANLDLAHQLGIDGTPAFVIGPHLLAGAAEVSELRRVVGEARAGR